MLWAWRRRSRLSQRMRFLRRKTAGTPVPEPNLLLSIVKVNTDLDKLDAVGMTLHAEIEAAQPVPQQAVTIILQHDRPGPVPTHDGLDDRLEHALEGLVVDAVAQWEFDVVVLPIADAQLTGAGEVPAVLVEGADHHVGPALLEMFSEASICMAYTDEHHAWYFHQNS